jgi:hypothetical protein
MTRRDFLAASALPTFAPTRQKSELAVEGYIFQQYAQKLNKTSGVCTARGSRDAASRWVQKHRAQQRFLSFRRSRTNLVHHSVAASAYAQLVRRRPAT